MREEVQEWIEKAERDLKVAKDNVALGNYETVCFHSQQSAEKAMKSLYIKKFDALLKIHDIALLAKKLNAPEEIVSLSHRLSTYYVSTRYPGPDEPISKEDANSAIKMAQEVLAWVKKNL